MRATLLCGGNITSSDTTTDIVWLANRDFEQSVNVAEPFEIARAMEPRGYRATIVLPVRAGGTPRLPVHFADIRLLWPLPPFSTLLVRSIFSLTVLHVLATVNLLRSQGRRRAPYLVVDHETYLIGVALKMIRGWPLILNISSPPVEATGIRAPLTNCRYRLSVLLAKYIRHGITVVSSAMREEVSSQFGIPQRRIGLLTTGVSTSLFDADASSPSSQKLRSMLNLETKFILMYHGVFTGNRGLKEAVRSMQLLAKRFPDVILFLLGDGPTKNTLRDMVSDLNLENNVIIHGPVVYTEVPKYVGMCDIGLLPLPPHPYWNNQCPLKLLEYLAMKKPVIVTDVPGHREILGESACCRYLESLAPDSIMQAVEYFYLRRDELETLGSVGRSLVSKRYSWEAVATRLDSYLRGISWERG